MHISCGLGYCVCVGVNHHSNLIALPFQYATYCTQLSSPAMAAAVVRAERACSAHGTSTRAPPMASFASCSSGRWESGRKRWRIGMYPTIPPQHGGWYSGILAGGWGNQGRQWWSTGCCMAAQPRLPHR